MGERRLGTKFVHRLIQPLEFGQHANHLESGVVTSHNPFLIFGAYSYLMKG